MGLLEDKISSLSYALERSEGLKRAIRELNENAVIFERLAIAIEKQNRLKERELELLEYDKGLTLSKKIK